MTATRASSQSKWRRAMRKGNTKPCCERKDKREHKLLLLKRREVAANPSLWFTVAVVLSWSFHILVFVYLYFHMLGFHVLVPSCIGCFTYWSFEYRLNESVLFRPFRELRTYHSFTAMAQGQFNTARRRDSTFPSCFMSALFTFHPTFSSAFNFSSHRSIPCDQPGVSKLPLTPANGQPVKGPTTLIQNAIKRRLCERIDKDVPRRRNIGSATLGNLGRRTKSVEIDHLD